MNIQGYIILIREGGGGWEMFYNERGGGFNGLIARVVREER